MKSDVYQTVTDRIIADLEKGELTWLKPWSAGNASGRITRPLRHNGLGYGGINVLMLWAAAIEAGYSSACWMTFRQATELGAHVRRSEKGSMVVYAGTISREGDENDDGDKDKHEEEGEGAKRIPFLKTYSVFNVEQIDGLPDHYHVKPEPVIDPVERIAHADQFFAATRAVIRHGGNRAYYSGASDHVQMPCFESFRSADAYCATLAHELTHWTKHESRLDRKFGVKKFGDEAYAREELVAELGTAFLCADLALTPEPGAEHAAYIQSWLKVLRQDKRALFSAAAHAQRAVEFLHGLQSSAGTGREVAA
jgi:antirestriction protein ArdC